MINIIIIIIIWPYYHYCDGVVNLQDWHQLGTPSRAKSSVFFYIVQTAFDPPLFPRVKKRRFGSVGRPLVTVWFYMFFVVVKFRQVEIFGYIFSSYF